MLSLEIVMRRCALCLGHHLLRVYWLVPGRRGRSVKCVVYQGQRVLLVRHSYRDWRRWELPGGTVRRGERPVDAARREIHEELGIDVTDWVALGDLFARVRYGRATMWCFAGRVSEPELRPDHVEIAEAGWFEPGRLPVRVGRWEPRVLTLTHAILRRDTDLCHHYR